jgi:hypothetical protein
MKQLPWDPWQAAGRNHPTIDIINFRSIDNPAFPKEEYPTGRAFWVWISAASTRRASSSPRSAMLTKSRRAG